MGGTNTKITSPRFNLLSPRSLRSSPRNSVSPRSSEKKLHQESTIIHVTIVGTGDGGKTSLFRQILTILKPPLEHIQTVNILASDNIIENILSSTRRFCEKVILYKRDEKHEMHLHDDKIDLLIRRIPGESLDLLKKLYNLLKQDDLTPVHVSYSLEVYKSLVKLYDNEAIIRLLKAIHSTCSIGDGVVEILQNLGDYYPEFQLTYEDGLMRRYKTIGCSVVTFPLKEGVQMTLSDTAGQRSERKKWMFCWEDPSCIILYCVSLTDYYQLCYEDDFTNRLAESLACFSSLVNSQRFREHRIVLLLTKTDIFEEKLQYYPLRDFFPLMPPSYLLKEKHYILDKFLETNHYDADRILPYFLNTLDVDQVEIVLFDVFEKFGMNSMELPVSYVQSKGSLRRKLNERIQRQGSRPFRKFFEKHLLTNVSFSWQ